jgi:hypothetical protein
MNAHRRVNSTVGWHLISSETRMRYLMHISILLLLMLASASTSAQSTPRTAAHEFYRTYLKLRVRGLPNKTQRKTLWPLLAPDLRQMFDAAERAQTRFSREHPDEKPPWCEGDLFSSLFEGARSFTVGAPKINGDRAGVPINLVFRDKKDTARWTDTLILSGGAGRWRVWDIRFNGDWPFKTGNSLRSVLKIE